MIRFVNCKKRKKSVSIIDGAQFLFIFNNNIYIHFYFIDFSFCYSIISGFLDYNIWQTKILPSTFIDWVVLLLFFCNRLTRIVQRFFFYIRVRKTKLFSIGETHERWCNTMFVLYHIFYSDVKVDRRRFNANTLSTTILHSYLLFYTIRKSFVVVVVVVVNRHCRAKNIIIKLRPFLPQHETHILYTIEYTKHNSILILYIYKHKYNFIRRFIRDYQLYFGRNIIACAIVLLPEIRNCRQLQRSEIRW